MRKKEDGPDYVLLMARENEADHGLLLILAYGLWLMARFMLSAHGFLIERWLCAAPRFSFRLVRE